MAQRQRRGRVCEELRDRATFGENPRLFETGAREVTGIRVEKQRERKERGYAERDPGGEPARHAPPVGRGALLYGIHRTPKRWVSAPGATIARSAESR